MSHPLWQFSLERYARAAVRNACLAAQDRHAGDVNLLLYLAWLEQQGLQRRREDWRALRDSLRGCRSAVTAVRRLRRALSGEQAPGRSGLLAQARETELSLEQLEQGLIHDWHLRHPTVPADPESLQRQLLWLLPTLAGDRDTRDGLLDCLRADA